MVTRLGGKLLRSSWLRHVRQCVTCNSECCVANNMTKDVINSYKMKDRVAAYVSDTPSTMQALCGSFK